MKYCTVVQDAAAFPLPVHDWLVGTQLHLLLIQLINTIHSGNIFFNFNICMFFFCIFYFGFQADLVCNYIKEKVRGEVISKTNNIVC